MSGTARQQVLHFQDQVVNAMHTMKQVAQMVSFNSVSSHVSFTAKLLFLYLEKYLYSPLAAFAFEVRHFPWLLLWQQCLPNVFEPWSDCNWVLEKKLPGGRVRRKQGGRSLHPIPNIRIVQVNFAAIFYIRSHSMFKKELVEIFLVWKLFLALSQSVLDIKYLIKASFLETLFYKWQDQL